MHCKWMFGWNLIENGYIYTKMEANYLENKKNLHDRLSHLTHVKLQQKSSYQKEFFCIQFVVLHVHKVHMYLPNNKA